MVGKIWMREIDGWRFLGFYGVIYLLIMIFITVSYPLAQTYGKPVAALIFPIAQNNSLVKNLAVVTAMYWVVLIFYTVIVQKIRIKF